MPTNGPAPPGPKPRPGPPPPKGQRPVPGGLIGSAGVAVTGSTHKAFVPAGEPSGRGFRAGLLLGWLLGGD